MSDLREEMLKLMDERDRLRTSLRVAGRQFELLEKLALSKNLTSEGKKIPVWQAVAEEARAAKAFVDRSLNSEHNEHNEASLSESES